MGGHPWSTEAATNIAKLTLAVAALALLLAEAWLRRAARADRRTPHDRTRVVTRALAALGLLSLVAYVNFGAFHIGIGFVHGWEGFHHYVGAKYFDELGYDGLYDCKVVADAQEPGASATVATRAMTDLRTNQVVSSAELLAHPERCLGRFSPARWEAFRADVGFFRAMLPEVAWVQLQLDHGFNASPAWMLLASPLTRAGPVTRARLVALGVLDAVLVVAALAAVGWAFGLRALAVVAIVLGGYFPARFWWTGGSFLRWDWLAALLAGLSLCRRGKPACGGALFGYAALSRVFPAFALAGAGLAILGNLLRRRRPDPACVRVCVGALVAAAILVPGAELAHARPAWSAFAHNLAKHSGAPSANRMGLATLLSYDPETSLARLPPEPVAVARARWEDAHARTLRRRRAATVALAAAAVVAVMIAARDQPAFAACGLGLLLLPFGPALACYYYAFVAAAAVLATRRAQVATILLALVAAAALVARLDRYAMDEQYAAQSLLAVVALTFVLSLFLGRSVTDDATARAQFDV